METPKPRYLKHFLKSPHHAWLGLLTLGTGLMYGDWPGLLVGAAAYALCWVYVPDMPVFRRWTDRREETRRLRESHRQTELFVQRRDAVLARLTPTRRNRYSELAAICREIETDGADAPVSPTGTSSAVDPRLRRLEELMWTYLRLLTTEESLQAFLEKERDENLQSQVKSTEADVDRLAANDEEGVTPPDEQVRKSRERLRESRIELLDVLRRRVRRVEQAQASLEVVLAEQERLSQQVRLIRADKMAARKTDALSSMIDLTIANLDQTNKWLADMDDFRDITGDLPPGDVRFGFGAASEPTANPEPRRARAKTPSTGERKR